MKSKRFGRCAVAAILSLTLSPAEIRAEVYDASTGYVTQRTTSSKNVMAMDPSLWSDGAIPHSGTNYYVAANGLLYCSYASVTNFAGDKLVLGGYIRQLASTYANRIVFPHVEMLPGSYILHSAAGRIEVTRCTVKGTADSPAACWQGDADSKGGRNLYQDITWEGGEDAWIVFKRRLHGSGNVATVRGGFSGNREGAWNGYAGTAVFTGPLLRYIYEASVDSQAAFVVTNGAALSLGGDAVSLRRLEVHDGAAAGLSGQSRVSIGDLLISEGGTVSVPVTSFFITNSLVLGGGAKISFSSNPFGNWRSGDPPDPVALVTFGKNVARPADYGNALKIPAPENANGGVPGLVYYEKENEDGSVTVSVGYREVVVVTENASHARTPFNPLDPDYSMLSDRSPISSEKDYYNNGRKLYVIGANCEFAGHSLTISGGWLSVYTGRKFTCENLYLTGGWIGQQKATGSAYFDGNIHVQGGAVMIGGDGNRITGIYSELHGTEDLPVKRGEVDEDDVTKKCWLELRGDNSGFSGRIVFGDHTASNANLRIWNKSNLGGAREEFTADALSVSDSCALYIMADEGDVQTSPEVFDDLTRGWLFEGNCGIAAEKDACVYNRITIGKVLTKSGTGTLSVADVTGEEGAEIAVGEGAIRFLAADAVVNLPALSFAEGTKMVVDAYASDAGLVAGGVDLSATQVTFPEDGVTVEFINVDPEKCAGIAVATLAEESAADSFRFVRPEHCAVRKTVVPLGDGKFLLKAEISKNAMKVIVR